MREFGTRSVFPVRSRESRGLAAVALHREAGADDAEGGDGAGKAGKEEYDDPHDQSGVHDARENLGEEIAPVRVLEPAEEEQAEEPFEEDEREEHAPDGRDADEEGEALDPLPGVQFLQAFMLEREEGLDGRDALFIDSLFGEEVGMALCEAVVIDGSTGSFGVEVEGFLFVLEESKIHLSFLAFLFEETHDFFLAPVHRVEVYTFFLLLHLGNSDRDFLVDCG